ncbi:unnamed protein product [Ectocarpus fasciculatus]
MRLTMVRRVSGARALASLLVLSSFVQLCRAFGGISGRTAATSTASRTGGGRHHAHGGGVRHRSLSPVVGLPPRAQHGLRSEAGDGGQGGGGDGGMFGGIQEWWERDGKSDLKIYGTSLALALVVRSVALEPRFIPSLSMFPTFEIGDQLAVDKLSSKLSRPYQRKDVVVFYPPPKFREFSDRGKKDALIKRVIAVGGDAVQIKDGSLFVNGQEQFEDYTFEEPEYSWGPQTVPEGMVMVLGDNRNHSLDSHIWGFLPTENVIGRAIFKYWPPWRAGTIET